MSPSLDKTVLLHLCCAPCSTSVLERLRSAWSVTGYFFNPNIHPETEYQKRLGEMGRLAQQVGLPLFIGPHDMQKWFSAAAGLEKEPEGGRRCEICFRLRLEATARKARDLGMDAFASTLTVSPHKNSALIHRVGEELARQYGVGFIREDFKKKGGFQRSMELSREAGLYRQHYCGCCYSRRE